MPSSRLIPRQPRASGRRRGQRRNPVRCRGRGQALVEFAIVLPVMLLILLLAIDFGRLFFSYVQITNAAREGAAYAANDPTNTAAITTRARQETDAQGQGGESPITVSVSCKTPPNTSIPCASSTAGTGIGNQVIVAVDERFTFLTPLINGFFGGGLTMNATATSSVLGLAAAAGSGPPSSCSPPDTPSFTVSASNLTVSVDASASTPNSGVCAISGYNWSFNDPNATPAGSDSSTGVTTNYTYVAAGTYTVALTVTNQGGTASTSRTVTVTSGSPTCTAPVAAFTVNPTSGQAASGSGTGGTNFQFDGSSTTNMTIAACNPTWRWDFGTGNTADDKSGETTSFIYPATFAGRTVTVTLTASNNGGSSTATTPITLSAACPLTASFTDKETGRSGKFTFTDTSTGGPTSWSWTFGDGSTSTLQSPSHNYSGAGPYTVTLTVGNGSCTSVPYSQSVTP